MRKKKCVLLIEDEEDTLRAMLATIIKRRREDYLPLVGVDGHEALEFLNSRNIDLLVLDLAMQNLDGMEVCRRVKADSRMKDIPIIVSSGHLSPEVIHELHHMGIRHILPKPYPMNELLDKIDQVLKAGA